MNPTLKLLMAAGLTLLLAGCGSSSSSGSTTPEPQNGNGNGNGEPPAFSVSLTPGQQTLELGESADFVLTLPDGSGNATWSCSAADATVATAVETAAGCRATGLGPGDTELTAVVLHNGDAAEASAGLHIPQPASGDPVQVGQLLNIPHGAHNILLKDHLAVIVTSLGMRLVDVTNPANPVLGETAEFAFPLDMAISGDLVLFAAQSSGLVIIDISDPEAPVEAGHLPPPLDASITAVAVSGNTAYLANGCFGFYVVDIGNPATPQIIGNMESNRCVSGVAVGDNTAYLSGPSLSSGLLVVDISNPSNPTQVGHLTLDGGRYITYRDNHVYLSGDELKMAIVDVNDSTLPQLLMQDAIDGWGGQPLVMGSRLYFTANELAPTEHRVHVLDISDPVNPVDLGSFTPNVASFGSPSIAIAGRYGYITAGSTLLVYDLGDLAP